MNTEFKLSYNGLNSIKEGNFNEYSTNMISAYDEFEKVRSLVSSDAYLSNAWSKTVSILDNIMHRRDSMDYWFTNYLENIKNLEAALPDNKYSFQMSNTRNYLKNHDLNISNVDINGYMSANKGAAIVKPEPVQPTPVSSGGSSSGGSTGNGGSGTGDTGKKPTSTTSTNAGASKPKPSTTSTNAGASKPKPSTTSANAGAGKPKPSTPSAINIQTDKRFQTPSAINTKTDTRFQGYRQRAAAASAKSNGGR
ncbi:MAG: hypothetical protein IKF36_04410 [Bacilli bacterium]|nr:hypothetical protein [Bacilli bacterium]